LFNSQGKIEMTQAIDNRLTPKGLISAVLMAGTVMMGAANFGHAQPQNQAEPASHASMRNLGTQLEVGDVVFIRIPSQPFTTVANTTSSWTNHVGIVSDVSGVEPVIAESRVPFSGNTTWSRFVGRSDAGRVAVARLSKPLDEGQKIKVRQAVEARRGILYDTGFDLHSKRQFCSRYVREVLEIAAGVNLGEVENFDTLLERNPQANQTFWRMWYFGKIPWQRETVTPASLLRDDRMNVYFDGYVDNRDYSVQAKFSALQQLIKRGSGK